jgi:hypothetical protein
MSFKEYLKESEQESSNEIKFGNWKVEFDDNEKSITAFENGQFVERITFEGSKAPKRFEKLKSSLLRFVKKGGDDYDKWTMQSL